MASFSDHCHASSKVVICAAIVLCVLTTPLGLLVVPEVNNIIARRSGAISGRVAASLVMMSSTLSSSMLRAAQRSTSDSR